MQEMVLKRGSHKPLQTSPNVFSPGTKRGGRKGIQKWGCSQGKEDASFIGMIDSRMFWNVSLSPVSLRSQDFWGSKY